MSRVVGQRRDAIGHARDGDGGAIELRVACDERLGADQRRNPEKVGHDLGLPEIAAAERVAQPGKMRRDRFGMAPLPGVTPQGRELVAGRGLGAVQKDRDVGRRRAPEVHPQERGAFLRPDGAPRRRRGLRLPPIDTPPVAQRGVRHRRLGAELADGEI
jgi:hypothetical protein